MILCDTSALIALVKRKDKNHAAVKVFEGELPTIPTTVWCEVDYFLTKYMGEHVAKVFLEKVASSRKLIVFDAIDLARVNQIRRFYEARLENVIETIERGAKSCLDEARGAFLFSGGVWVRRPV